MPTDDRLTERATTLRDLHLAPEILVLVNVWDAISARVLSDVPGIRALATASHSVAATLGYPDGEVIGVEEMVAFVGRIVAATGLPVTADLEAGYGNAGDTVRRAIDVGVVGANLEDQMRPLADAVAAVSAAVAAGEQAGVPFVLNARTDAFLRAGDRPRAEVTADAVERGRAFLDAGATCVFVPGLLDADTVHTLVEAYGPQRLSLISVPGALSVQEMQAAGVARVSTGPWSQRVALTAFADLATTLLQGGSLPPGVRPLT